MNQFNVELFDENFNFLFNTCADKIKYKEDYLDPEKAKITVTSDARISANSIIRLYRDGEEYAGIISNVKAKDDGTTEVTFTSVEALFDAEILIDVSQISGTMEQYMKACMDELYVTNSDLSQRLPVEIEAVSSTNNWTFDYEIENEPKEDEEPPVREVAFINILDDLIIPAFVQYGIVLEWSFDFNTSIIMALFLIFNVINETNGSTPAIHGNASHYVGRVLPLSNILQGISDNGKRLGNIRTRY